MVLGGLGQFKQYGFSVRPKYSDEIIYIGRTHSPPPLPLGVKVIHYNGPRHKEYCGEELVVEWDLDCIVNG